MEANKAKKDQIKIILIALGCLLIISIISFVISFFSKDTSELLKQEIGYLIVMTISLISFLITLPFYLKIK